MAFYTHLRRFGLLLRRLNTWARGWTFSVSMVVQVIPGAVEGLEQDMAAFVNLLEEMQEAITDLACDFQALDDQVQKTLGREILSDG